MTATKAKKASAETVRAAKALAASAAKDFAETDGCIAASWTPEGVLVVVATGDRAMELDHTMSLEGIAVPDGRHFVGGPRPGSVPRRHESARRPAEHEQGHR